MKKLFIAMGLAVALATPLALVGNDINAVYAVDEPQVVEPTTTETAQDDKPTENVETPTEPSESVETPVEPSEPTEPTEPTEQPIEPNTSENSTETEQPIIPIDPNDPPQIDNPNGNKVLDTINWLFQQAWFYLPVIISFLSAIGIPAIVKIVSIVGSQKLNEHRNKKTIKKVNNVVDLINVASAFNKEFINGEINYLQAMLANTLNKKQKDAIEARITTLLALKETLDKVGTIEKIKAEDMTKKVIKQEAKEEKVKVRVKVVDDKSKDNVENVGG